jgi:ubiquinone/menaquinone biosynthesis C-methylase UbiE
VDRNPQAAQMADDSMVRTLAAQARAIWPQEVELLQRYVLPSDASILDAGCGTGEGASRIAALFPNARVLAVDILDDHLKRARSLYADLGLRLTFEHQSIFALEAHSASFDLTVCRHVLHSIPEADAVISELARVTRPGGYLHLIVEDYGMLHFRRGLLDPQDFWHEGPRAMERAMHIDLSIGRNTFGILSALGLEDIAIDYIVVDTIRVPRDTFATIIEAWRDGYADAIGELTSISSESALDYFNAMIANIRDPMGYAVWMVPVASARIPVGNA